MTHRNCTLRGVATGIALGCMSAMPTLADDTEIYVGANYGDTYAKANVLFIIDTSGSMASQMVSQPSYDASTTYAGCFDTDRIYWTTGSPPSCGTSRWFHESYNKCDASSSLSTTGYFQDRFARYSSNLWRSLTTSSTYKQRNVDCVSDHGVHGENTGEPQVWAANNTSDGWSASESQQIDWKITGYNYTLYTGNFMNYLATDPDVLRSRIDIIKDVIADLVDSTNNVNIGLMRFSSNGQGGMITYDMEEIASARDAFKTEMQGYSPSGTTPLSESLYEAALYHMGGAVDYGDSSSPSLSITASRLTSDTDYYDSPIVSECQKNNIVLLTDGEPVSDTAANTKVANLPGFLAATGVSACQNEHGDNDGMCLDEIASYMYNHDMSDEYAGEQRVVTYTVGFATNQQLLQDTATAGGGRYQVANDAAQLTTAFSAILADVLAQDATFAAPAVAVNAFNRTTHREELYFTVFRPDARPHWDGNLKKYRLGFETDPDTGETVPEVQDKNGNNAVDPDTGYFKDSAESYWLASGELADGSQVNKGGAAAVLTLPRNVYTYTGSGAPVNVSLTASDNAVHENNTALTETLLDLAAGSTAPSRDELVEWARGVDTIGTYSEGGPRPVLGDPLHSRAAAVQYGGTEESPDLTLFFTTNDGYLHAVDEGDGTELFSFVPQELLPNLKVLYLNEPGVTRTYGLDGSVTTWVYDENEDGIIEADDHVYLYVGMRRGGHSYYALDVTDRSAPKLMWRITNDTNSDGTPDGSFAELGQTWSDPVVRKIRFNGEDKTVLIFGGGYDVDQDGFATPGDDTEGRAVFVVDAVTGARLWWAGPSGSGADLELAAMTNSIPSSINAIDIDGDGLTERLYVGDMRAQVWRFDFKKTNTGAADLATGGVIYSLGGNNPKGNRRFFYPPDVALSGFPGHAPHLSLVIGSGYRAHPLNQTIEDRIYMLRDYDIFSAPLSYTTRTVSDLYDATDNDAGEGTETERAAARVAIATADGWYIRLADSTGSYIGEKVLASPLILDNTALVTTFDPTAAPLTPGEPVSCAPRAGQGRVYYMALADAQPVINFDEIGSDSALTAADRALLLSRGGIPPAPTLVIAPEDNAVLVGPEVVPDPTQGRAVRTYWHQH